MQLLILGIILIISAFVLFFAYKLSGTSVLMLATGLVLVIYDTLPDTRQYSCIDSSCVPKPDGVFGTKKECVKICGAS